MKLRKIISGGQTGADRTALECARDIGLETGGTAPKGYKTDAGKDPALKLFGLVESGSSDYAVRTRDNVRNSDATFWFGKTDSPGYYCTRNACRLYEKPFYENPGDISLGYAIQQHEVINCAGNRLRIHPPVVKIVQDAFTTIKLYKEYDEEHSSK